jgi:y4mF family transcriptional regulator
MGNIIHFFKEYVMTVEQILQTIRPRRQLLKITQTDLAELSGVSLRTIKALEEGQGNPTIELLLKVLNVLGLTLTTAERVHNE